MFCKPQVHQKETAASCATHMRKHVNEKRLFFTLSGPVVQSEQTTAQIHSISVTYLNYFCVFFFEIHSYGSFGLSIQILLHIYAFFWD